MNADELACVRRDLEAIITSCDQAGLRAVVEQLLRAHEMLDPPALVRPRVKVRSV